jgi:hypothetical protein
VTNCVNCENYKPKDIRGPDEYKLDFTKRLEAVLVAANTAVIHNKDFYKRKELMEALYALDNSLKEIQ